MSSGFGHFVFLQLHLFFWTDEEISVVTTQLYVLKHSFFILLYDIRFAVIYYLHKRVLFYIYVIVNSSVSQLKQNFPARDTLFQTFTGTDTYLENLTHLECLRHLKKRSLWLINLLKTFNAKDENLSSNLEMQS